jgi:hypothetical protein
MPASVCTAMASCQSLWLLKLIFFIFYLFLFLFFYCFSLHVCECPVKRYQQIRRVVVFLNLLIIILGL